MNVRFDRVSLKLNNFLQELFCLWLLVVVETKHSILLPLCCIVGGLNQLVNDLALSVFNIANTHEFFGQSVILRLLLLFERSVYFLAGCFTKRFELADNITRQIVLGVCDLHHFFQFFLEEDVKLSLKLVLSCGVDLLAWADLAFEFFNNKSENGFLKLGPYLDVLIRLCEFGQESLPSTVS
jgi:hypothetical protein